MIRRIAFAGAALVLVTVSASAQNWPTQPIRWIVPYPAGGGTDLMARTLGVPLEKTLGQPIVVENKPGASTVTGTAALTQAEPDGHTVGMVFDSLAINAALGMKLPYDSEKDFAPVINLARVPLVLMVNSSLVPMKTLPELVAHAKANPGWFTFGSLGPGSPHEIGFAWLKTLTKMDALIVPYRGVNPALQDLIAGNIKGMFLGVAVADEFIRQGKLHAIGVSSKDRLKSAPNLPTIAEQGYPEYDFVTFYGLAAPKGTPQPIVRKLNEAINAALKLPEIRAKIDPTGAEIVGGTPEEFDAFLKANMSKLKRIVTEAGIKSAN
ncbi:tripartite tricarboxylate transporter substrate binding protein [Pseudorhodoplanes sp.]|uniref:Bug family tripartite tricarboxylate transporter substrate binding protein n=1 Tax=Pseudorhodoplanes sp. TaxID=1934341 RepID=UPI002C477D2E|nr:tripartite tricarboxylate transporter substrate binding protein [Pseudorhodoplanes sp.]HWV41655.1 tripartite tricarboxylate transporter substrate binding protein [Pseudorhodoplanes sp.]